MVHFVRCVAVAAALLAAPVAVAQPAAETAAVGPLKAGALLLSSDGKRIGRIERVVKSADGTPVSVSLIADSRFIYVPASTISPSEKGFSTSLTRAEVRKLK
jgi:hypothetical protein